MSSKIQFHHPHQDFVASYFEYKIEIKKDSPEFQTLGWVDEDWWFSRMSHQKIPREICFGAAIIACQKNLFEIYAASDCERCGHVSRWIENPFNAGHIDGLDMPCTNCGHGLSRRPEDIRWNFKLAKHLIKDENVYFSSSEENQDDLVELRKVSFARRLINMIFPWRKKNG